jgi:hypothetical protein
MLLALFHLVTEQLLATNNQLGIALFSQYNIQPAGYQ